MRWSGGGFGFLFIREEFRRSSFLSLFPQGGRPEGLALPKAFPLGGRWLAEGQTDEGTDFGLGSLDTERFRRHLRAKSRPSGGCAPKRACGRSRRRGTFPAMGKYPKDRRGTAQNGHFVSIFALPPDPHYGGRVPVAGSRISGAQNLSGWSKFPPGHWALGLQKFPLVRFHDCAWIYRANAPGVEYAVGAAPCGRPRAGLEPAPTQKTHPPLYLP